MSEDEEQQYYQFIKYHILYFKLGKKMEGIKLTV